MPTCISASPAQEAKETIATGAEAAINGGITGVVMMPNTSPAIDSGTVVGQVLDIAKRTARIPVYTSGCVTKGRHGKELAGIDGMRAQGVKMLTDDGDTTGDPAVLYRAMQYATEFGMFFASHCEVPELAGPRALNEGAMSYRLGIKGSPACAEEIIIDRDIRLAHATGAHIHIQHVSSKLGMETIAWWKSRGDVRVTAEVSPHHLLFCRRGHRRLRHPLQDEPAAPYQGGQRGAAPRCHRRHLRSHRHRPRAAHAV